MKDPNWLSDAGYGFLAPGIFGCQKAWQGMTEASQVKYREDAIRQFAVRNSMSWDEWHTDYTRRVQMRST